MGKGRNGKGRREAPDLAPTPTAADEKPHEAPHEAPQETPQEAPHEAPPTTKPTEVRLAEVIDMYASLRGAGLLDDEDLEGFRAACQAYVRAAQSSSGRDRVRSAGGRVLEYDLRRRVGQETFAVLRAHPDD